MSKIGGVLVGNRALMTSPQDSWLDQRCYCNSAGVDLLRRKILYPAG